MVNLVQLGKAMLDSIFTRLGLVRSDQNRSGQLRLGKVNLNWAILSYRMLCYNKSK